MRKNPADDGQCKRVNAIKVFSATRFRDRNSLGEVVTSWLERHPTIEIADIVVRQSSDREFHCVSITFLYWHSPDAAAQSAASASYPGRPWRPA